MVKPDIENIIEPHWSNRKKPSVMEVFPELAGEWHYPLNCGFGPEDFSCGSNVRVWWKCERDKNHIWKSQIYQRCTRGFDCPFCFGKNMHGLKIAPERSLAFLFPEIAKDWHPTKNGTLKPEDVLAGANTKIFWRCKENKRHIWQASIKTRTTNGHGCPICYDERRLDLRDFPEILALFDRKKNKGVDPYSMTTNMTVWWRCPVAPDHCWQSRFNKKSLLCACCRNRKASVTNSLEALFPKIAKQLHPTRNGTLKASEITASSSKKLWWRCAYNPQHVWSATVGNRTGNKSGCPICFSTRRSKKSAFTQGK